jgi:LysR family nitrogen assimilation transcriptional regulator
MDLKEIGYFASVARAGSFIRAAQELRVAQPALSRKIRKLERDLGVDLLVRHGRGVRLTAAGALFIKNADAINDLVRRAKEQVSLREAEASGHVTFGAPPAAGLLLTPPVVERFRREWPNVTLHIREGVSSTLQEWILDRRLDVAVLYNPPALQALEITPVLTERMVIVGPPKPGPQGNKRLKVIRVADLPDYPMIMPSQPHNNRHLLERAADQQGVRLKIAIEVDSVAFTKALIKRGLGYTMLTYASVQDEVKRGELTAYAIEQPAITSKVAIAFSREAAPSRFALELTRVLRTTIRDLVSQGVWARAMKV